MTSDSEKRTSELEKQLLDAQDRLHQVESLAGIGHWSLDHRTQAFFISRHAESIMGIDQPHAELNFDDFISRVHPDDREGIERVFQDSVKQRTGYDISYRVLLTDGTIKYINERCRHEFDSSGRVNRSFGTLLDITKQLGNERQAQRDQRVLEKSEANFRDLVETSHDLICQLDDVGIFTYLNSAWEDVLGYKLEEMLGHNFTEFKEPEETAKMIPIYEGEREQVSDYETSYINKSGDRVILRFRTKPQNDIDGNRIGVQGTAYDITDQRRAEIALQESEKRFRDMFQSSSDAQLLVDSNGSILLVNAQTEITFGYTTSEITGSNLNRLIPERFDDHTKYMHEYFHNPKARRMSPATNLIRKNRRGSR